MPPADHAQTFVVEVAVSGELFGLEFDEGGDPPLWPFDTDRQARPFWSSHRRAAEMLAGPLASGRLRVAVYTWEAFESAIAPALQDRGVLVGLNWSGAQARGYNRTAAEVIAAVNAERARHPGLDQPSES